MARRKRNLTPEDAPETAGLPDEIALVVKTADLFPSEPPPIGDEPETPEPAIDPDQPIYTLGKWKGYDNFLCSFCPHSTLSEDVAIRHFIDRHAPKPPAPELPSPSVLAIANKNGRQIN